MEIELVPYLSNCIQTLSKKEYEQAMMDLLNASEKVYSYEGSPEPKGV